MSNKRSRNHKSCDLNREREVLAAPVNPTGAGEDPAVRAALSKEFTTMKDADAAQIALALQTLIRGQSALHEDVVKLAARMNHYDETAAKFEADRIKFLDDLRQQSEKLRLPEDKRIALQARVESEAALMVGAARMSMFDSQRRFETELETMPRVMVRHPGVVRVYSVDGVPTPKVEPLIVRIKNRAWVLPPDKDVEVPQCVADVLAQQIRSEQENAERMQVLSATKQTFGKDNRDTDVSQKLLAIDRKYKSTSAMIPVAS